jgi:hypothetical protein
LTTRFLTSLRAVEWEASFLPERYKVRSMIRKSQRPMYLQISRDARSITIEDVHVSLSPLY